MDRDELNAAMGLTEDQLNELAAPFEAGDWDASAYAPAQRGRPLLFEEPMQSVSFKVAPSTVSKMDERAKSQGKSRSDYLRALVAADLATA